MASTAVHASQRIVETNTRRRGLARLLALPVALALALPGVGLGVARAAGATWYVAPGGTDSTSCGTTAGTPCATVNQAIVNAGVGDTIAIAAGTYHQLVIVRKDNLTLQGASQTSTILDGTGLGGSVVTIQSGLTATTIDNLTIEHGTGTVVGSDVFGGGIYAPTPGVALTLNNDSIIANSVTSSTAGGHADGGGIYDLDGTLAMNGCTVSQNSATSTVAGVSININQASDAALVAQSGTVANSTISYNTVTAAGVNSKANDAGIDMLNFYGTTTVSNSTISHNTASASGTGSKADDTGVQAFQTIVATIDVSYNTVTATGTGSTAMEAGVDTLDTTMSNSTISHNIVTGDGEADDAGINPNNLTISNSTVSYNTVTSANGHADDAGIDSLALTISHSTVSYNIVTSTNGNADDAAIDCQGTTLDSVVVAHNTVSAPNGNADDAGINSRGTTTMNNSTVSDNQVTAGGAGGFASDAALDPTSLTIRNSTVANNTVNDTGSGGIAEDAAIDASSPASISNSTVSGNTVTASGLNGIAQDAGIHMRTTGGASLTVINSTVANNMVSAGGSGGSARGGGIDNVNPRLNPTIVIAGAITTGTKHAHTSPGGKHAASTSGGIQPAVPVGVATLVSNVLAANLIGTTPTDCLLIRGTLLDKGGNLADDNTCAFTDPTSINNGNAALGPLQDNGGLPQGAPGAISYPLTQALGAASQARNLGIAVTCEALIGPDGVTTDTDERGFPRHSAARLNPTTGQGCDSGAWDSGDGFTNPATIAGAIQFPSLPGRLGFFGSTNPGYTLGYITFQDGASSLIAASPITVSCPDQCLGIGGANVPTILIPNGTATLTLTATVRQGRGAYAKAKQVRVIFTVTSGSRLPNGTVSPYTVTSVQVFVDGVAQTGVVSVPFPGMSKGTFLPF